MLNNFESSLENILEGVSNIFYIIIFSEDLSNIQNYKFEPYLYIFDMWKILSGIIIIWIGI